MGRADSKASKIFERNSFMHINSLFGFHIYNTTENCQNCDKNSAFLNIIPENQGHSNTISRKKAVKIRQRLQHNKTKAECRFHGTPFYNKFITKRPVKASSKPTIQRGVIFSLKKTAAINVDAAIPMPWTKGNSWVADNSRAARTLK